METDDVIGVTDEDAAWAEHLAHEEAYQAGLDALYAGTEDTDLEVVIFEDDYGHATRVDIQRGEEWVAGYAYVWQADASNGCETTGWFRSTENNEWDDDPLTPTDLEADVKKAGV